MERQSLLDALAEKILQEHNFDFQTFSEAKQTISMDNGAIQYTYDRLSLNVYSHSLEDEEFSYLGRKLKAYYSLRFSKEDQKQRVEYGVLLAFIKRNSDLSEYSIRKEVRPDFVISGQQHIGIEVTEFTTQADSVLETICSQNFGKGMSAKEMKANAIKKHGKKAESYHFYDIGETVAVGAGLQDINLNKEIYAGEVITKYEKYKTELHRFDKLIILCDARKVIGITSELDAKDVIDIVKSKCNIDNCTVCILYNDSLFCPKLATFVI